MREPHEREKSSGWPLSGTGKALDPAQKLPPHGYRAYGLTIRSELPLPELDRDAADFPELIIRLGTTGRPLPQSDSGTVCEFGLESQYVAWPGVGAFLIQGTHTIVIEPAAGVSMPLLNLPLLGPVVALLLHLRGLLVLHASAVDLGGRAVAFLGAKGAGKSTTVAAFVAAGHRLLADDVLAIDLSDPANPNIIPAFPQLKLAEDAASSLAVGSAIVMPRPIPEFPKQQRRLTGSFSHAAVPASCIYVLTRGPPARIVPLSAPNALGALLSFSFASLFQLRRSQLDKAMASAHLAHCAALAGAVRVARLELPSDLGRLPEIVGFVEDDTA
jgi:hypothetical protein